MEQRLANVGIHCISPDWLSACNEYLREQNQPINEDEILQQIMNTDLRNVVRRFDALAGSTGGSVLNSLPSIILRNTMKLSTESSHKAALPQSFKLIVQIEELLDVSQNAEERLALGPASSSSPTPIGNQSKRLLKMLISDGYFQNGDCRRLLNEGSSSNSSNHIVAMETEPIPNLSVHSKPGIKIALAGNIEIRFGIMMLHPGNTTVLGGCIPELIPIQKKAMSLAAKLAGIGIDPTFRALVWNPDSGMEEDEDEGEGESSDLPVRPARPANTGQTLQVQPANQPRSLSTRAAGPMANQRPLVGNTSTGTAHGNVQIVTNGISLPVHLSNPYQREPTMQQQQQIEQVPLQLRQQLHSGSRQQRSTAPNSSGLTPSVNPYRRQDTPSSTRIVAGTVNTSTPSNSGSLHNPYAAGNQMARIDTNSASRTSTATAPRQMSSTAAAVAIDLTSPNSLDASSPVAIAVSNISQMSIQSKTPKQSQSQPQHSTLIASNPYTIQSAKLTSTSTSTSTSSTKKYPLTTPKRNLATSSSTSFQSRLSPTALSEPMSFGELKELMNRITTDPDEYKLYEKKSFIVPCKYPAKNSTEFMGFKIEKQKDYKMKKGGEKYGFEMICQVMGNNDTMGKITCKLAHEVMKPYFTISAAEMRKMTKQDRVKANKMANEGGANALSDFRKLSTCHMRLVHNAKDLFKSPKTIEVDGADVLLEIYKREELEL